MGIHLDPKAKIRMGGEIWGLNYYKSLPIILPFLSQILQNSPFQTSRPVTVASSQSEGKMV